MPTVLNHEQITELLRRSAFCAGTLTNYCDVMARYGSVETYARGQWLAKEGGEAAYFRLILEGRVIFSVRLSSGQRIEAQTLGPQEVFGWSSILPPYLMNVDIKTLDHFAVVEFPAELVRAHMERDRTFGMEMLRRAAVALNVRLNATRLLLAEAYEKLGSLRHTVDTLERANRDSPPVH